MPDLSKLNFYSAVNYMKRDPASGYRDITLPAYGGTVSFDVTFSVETGTGKVPMYDVFAEIAGDNVIWNGGKISEYTDQGYLSGLSADLTYPEIESWITGRVLTISTSNFTSPLASGTCRIYWLIYKDYGKS
jgi:hypothetical protein